MPSLPPLLPRLCQAAALAYSHRGLAKSASCGKPFLLKKKDKTPDSASGFIAAHTFNADTDAEVQWQSVRFVCAVCPAAAAVWYWVVVAAHRALWFVSVLNASNEVPLLWR